ncbi:uncharacterized protein LOC131603228 [Vicia villosa]|uniref:uncharacterized protein LOC131603228 n=1 Tax=Vicia villosa TaxID=3911 RepID=UPI00273AF65C|nr:uncharacterized protein LOC131603228 [Vicia villosa]XP_058731500.1 uncharacterized protein LOC131603228 [Vicia villosa]
MGKKQSLRSKAVHLVSDLTTVLLNPISDHNKPSLPLSEEEEEAGELKGSESEVEGPDTSSFTAFLYSFLSSSDSGDNSVIDEVSVAENDDLMNENLVVKKSLLSRGKQSLGKAIYLAAKMGGLRNQERGRDGFESDGCGVEMKRIQPVKEVSGVPLVDRLQDVSEPSMLISNSLRNVVYDSLPSLIYGRKWLMMYSTWKHGISLSTLYRRSMLWPGPSLLVVGDRKGAVFGSLIDAPLRPSNKRKYQGTNSTFVFTNISGRPVVYRPTGVNRYFTLCTTDFLAFGGGGHFALYLDGDLLNGSSSVSETYNNPCLAHSPEFQVKEVELWGFVFPSKYEEIVKLSRTEAPGICRW